MGDADPVATMSDSSPSIETVLVPVDGSETSVTAVEYAIAIAEKYDAGVHVLYVLDEGVVRGIESGTIDEGVVAGETGAFVETAEELAADSGVEVATSTAYGFSVTQKTRHPGSVILDCADDVDADFVVVPREPASKEPDEILDRAAEHVLLYASQPVLSV